MGCVKVKTWWHKHIISPLDVIASASNTSSSWGLEGKMTTTRLQTVTFRSSAWTLSQHFNFVHAQCSRSLKFIFSNNDFMGRKEGIVLSSRSTWHIHRGLSYSDSVWRSYLSFDNTMFGTILDNWLTQTFAFNSQTKGKNQIFVQEYAAHIIWLLFNLKLSFL